MSNNTLPAEVLEEIKKKAKEYSSNASATDWENGATEYATKLYEAQQEIKSLKEQIEQFVLDGRDKDFKAKSLLEKFISRHEAGLLPDRFIYDEIKSFLYGK